MADENGNSDQNQIYSKRVRAGRRTYFFDVKATRANDLYLTITESKKRFKDNGDFYFEKHKIFLYKEDFDEFADSLEDALAEIRTLQAENNQYQDGSSQRDNGEETLSGNHYVEADFEDHDTD